MGINWADLSAGSHTRLWEHFNTLKAAINAVLDNVPAGRAIKSDGFQSAAGGVAVVMSQDYVQGGVTFDPSNGGGLKVPVAGVYNVAASVYFSGPAGRAAFEVQRWRSGAAVGVFLASTEKGTGEDSQAAVSGAVRLNAGDIITIYAVAASAVWGVTGVQTSLSVVKVG